jgi:sigma-B regulation protein RsbU (phosphoserine phosphatase)
MRPHIEDRIFKIDPPAKQYPNSIQKLARYFWVVYAAQNIVETADELDKQQAIEVLCVVDESLRPLGIVRREQIFLLLGKPFGRELMRKSSIRAIIESAPVFTGDVNIFSLSSSSPGTEHPYIILTNSGGVFSGMFKVQDLSNYMADITNKDIEMASELQERFLANADDIRNYNVKADVWSRSAKGVGGDFYFIRNLNETQFFAALCDVSGKGVAASVVVSMVWGFLRASVPVSGLKELLINLNACVVSTFQLEKYLTGFFLIYDAAKRRLSIADMGHSHAVLIRADRIYPLKETKVNLPIGVEVDINPVVCGLSVKTGDALLIYTDGIPEQDNPDDDEFGEDRLFDLARKCVSQKKNLDAIFPSCIDEFRRNIPQHDDMTFLLFQF